MNIVRPSEYLLLTGFTSDELLARLERGELAVELQPDRSLAIVLGEDDYRRLGLAPKDALPTIAPLVRPLVEEVVASQLLSFLENALPEALDLVERWRSQSASPASSHESQLE